MKEYKKMQKEERKEMKQQERRYRRLEKKERRKPGLIEKRRLAALCCTILLIGIFARVWQFGIVPGDINQDEAFGGYEAYSLLHSGVDSAGYAFPVYLTTWGSGMSVLNTYLMMPFIAIFGLHTWVIRLPQLLVSCFSLWVAYLVLKQSIEHQREALFGLFFLAINPWHIFMSRWGLDCNLASGFLLFGLYFFILGMEKEKYLVMSALMYGLSLYCYATIWPIVPVMLLLQVAYAGHFGKIKWKKETVIAGVLLLLLALPLLLFLAVNMGMLPEIRLPFLSIPKLVVMRSGEISLSNIGENAKNLWKILDTQTDGLPWNATEQFGIFYRYTLLFFAFELVFVCGHFIKSIKQKKFNPEVFLLIWLLGGILLGLLVSVNINRVNCLFLPVVLLSGLGIYHVFQMGMDILEKILEHFMPKKWEILFDVKYFLRLSLPILVYSLVFIRFEQYYFTDYKEEISWYFCEGLEDAMEAALEQEGTIYVTPNANYARVLFYSKQDVREYIDTVEYTNYPSAFLGVSSFGRFCFSFSLSELDEEGVYVVDTYTDSSIFTAAGYTIEQFGYYTVAYKQ